MEDAKQQIVEKLQNANNILVTVSANPTVDQLSACIGLTLLLNKMNKHATAVFSGKVPSTIEFLKPEETIETNTDSLRDFIISLDKSKADKLRYKVEDEVVKIFITPYKASINEKDLIYSQGDFNVDVVIALGVRQAQDLDNAITAHGRILHDAVVISINTSTSGGALGGINWVDAGASGLAELVTTLATQLGQNVLDAQIATALLTGIVAQTEHFSNQKTTPTTMTSSAALLAAGANQQLVSKELATKPPVAVTAPAPTAVPAVVPQVQVSADGELDVPHPAGEKPAKKTAKPADQKSVAEKPAAKTPAKPAPKAAAPEFASPAEPTPAADTPKAEVSEDGASTDPEDKLTARMKRIEPLHHDAPVPLKLDDEPVLTTPAPSPTPPPAEPAETIEVTAPAETTGIVTPTEPPEPDAPSAPLVLDGTSDDSLDALLQNIDSEGNSNAPAPAGPELPQPNPVPSSAPIIEVPPEPENIEPVIAAAEAKEEQAGQENKEVQADKDDAKEHIDGLEEQLAKLKDTPSEPSAAAESAEPTEPAPLNTVDKASSSPVETQPIIPPAPVPDPDTTPDNSDTLSDIEKSVHSAHTEDGDEADVDSARKAVEDALKSAPEQTLEPLAAVGAVNVDLNLGHELDSQPPIPDAQPGPGVPPVGLPDYLQTNSMAPAPNGNAAASNMPPFEDLPSTPMMGGIQTPPPQAFPPSSAPLPPQGPPPPLTPPPLA